jgi:cysteinyl-tRNA synthetase
MEEVLGLMDESTAVSSEGGESFTSDLLDLLVELRNDAKSNKDWANADRIRNTLSDMGVTVTDGKDGSTWSHD